MTAIGRLTRTPIAALEFANTILTEHDAPIGSTPKDVVWTHRNTTLWRYRSANRRYPVPVLLVFALINRPDIFDLRAGSSFVEFLLEEGYDVFLLDWGVFDESDSDIGLEYFVCEEIPSGIRETLRASGAGRGQRARLVHRRDAVAAALRARARHARPQPPAAHDARSTRAARSTSSGPPATRSTSTTSRTSTAPSPAARSTGRTS